MNSSYSHNAVFAAACLGMLLFGIVFLSLGSANNMLADRFGLDENSIGTLTVLLPLGILCGSLIFGPIVDRFGYRGLLVSAALLVGISLEGMAFSHSHRLVQLSLFLIGLGGGVLNGATNALAADVSEGHRGARLSLLGVFFGIGALAMPTMLATLSNYFSLSTIVAGIGATVLLPTAYFLAIGFPPPKQQADGISLGGTMRLLQNPVILIAGAALAIQSGMEGMSNDWMTRYFKNVTLTGQQGIEWMTQLGLVAVAGSMMLTRLALSQLLKRIRPRWVLYASIALVAAGAILMRTSSDYYVSLGAALLIGSGLAAAFPLILAYIGDLYPEQSGTAFSTIFVLALLGNMAVNKSFGYVAQRYGMTQYATALLVCLAISAVLIVCLHRILDTLPAKENS